MQYGLQDIKHLLGTFEIKGDTNNRFSNARSISDASAKSLCWVKNNLTNVEQALATTQSRFIIASKSLSIPANLNDKLFVLVDDPKLAFLRIVKELFSAQIEYKIHPTAIIHPEAKLASEVSIGAYSVIGKSTIGQRSIIYPHVTIYDEVTIGNNVIINSGTVIGADGFGYQRNERGEMEKFPHIGGVVIEDDVEIGSNTSIDRGTLGNTLIKQGAKIDNLVHIAHNVIIGKHSVIIANSLIGGSTKIGDESWVAPSATILNGLVIGNKVTAGTGAIVTKSIPDGETWTGSPARKMDEFLKIQKKLKDL